MAYDPKCAELAEYFLPNGTQKLKDGLAQHIQNSIEDWMLTERVRLHQNQPEIAGPSAEALSHTLRQ